MFCYQLMKGVIDKIGFLNL